MPRGIVIPADEAAPLRVAQFEKLADYQSAVGGYIEAMDAEEPYATFYLNEEGKLTGLPLNRRATLLWWGTTRAARNVDAFMGDVVLVGAPDEEGATTDVPAMYMEMLFPTTPFRIEVETIDAPDVWNGNAARYETCFDAWNAAFGLAERWLLVTNVRVVAA